MSNEKLPIILIRGFGFLTVEDEKQLPYQGFNQGTVYNQRVGENYIYEGFILRFLKFEDYTDATNIVGYYRRPHDRITGKSGALPGSMEQFEKYMKKNVVVMDPDMAEHFLRHPEEERRRSLWVFRYYDLDNRDFNGYAVALKRLIEIVRALTGADQVNIIAHSMGGLIARYTIQMALKKDAKKLINKIITLGTPHRGIDFQIIKNWIGIDAEKELEIFHPKTQDDKRKAHGWRNLKEHFPLDRLLCVIGTNYRTYSVAPASALNRAFSITREGSWAYNRSDGLVSQLRAYIPGAHRAFVHKCHGGYDSLVTSREAYEIATRFFFGTHIVRLKLVEAKIKKGEDWFGKSEYYIGVSAKPRNIDFELWHQSKEAENCYGPYRDNSLTKLDIGGRDKEEEAHRGLGKQREIAVIFLDASKSLSRQTDKDVAFDVVFRLDFYVGERDTYGAGFSDQEILKRQCFIQAVSKNDGWKLFLHPYGSYNEKNRKRLKKDGAGWNFKLDEPGAFVGTFRLELEQLA